MKDIERQFSKCSRRISVQDTFKTFPALKNYSHRMELKLANKRKFILVWIKTIQDYAVYSKSRPISRYDL